MGQTALPPSTSVTRALAQLLSLPGSLLWAVESNLHIAHVSRLGWLEN